MRFGAVSHIKLATYEIYPIIDLCHLFYELERFLSNYPIQIKWMVELFSNV